MTYSDDEEFFDVDDDEFHDASEGRQALFLPASRPHTVTARMQNCEQSPAETHHLHTLAIGRGDHGASTSYASAMAGVSATMHYPAHA